MNIREAKNYIDSLSTRGIKPGLSRVSLLCEKLGNPQDELRFIHVAGTNGKGSVCTYISQILIAAGIKTGCFTSPAVMEYRERYRISGRNVSQAALCRALVEVSQAMDAIEAEGEELPTQFEVETALAFQIFKEAGCEIVVLECGMGGKLDSTNIIKTTLVSVITSISMDHMAILGNSVEAIAKQKSGIIKPRGHVVTISQAPTALNVIKARCSLEKADLTIVSDSDLKNTKYGLKSSSFDLGKRKHIKLTMAGIYQPMNAALAVTAVDALKKEKIRIPDEAIYKGIEVSTWPGRFQIIAKKPMFIIDGAHNEDAASRLSESISFYLHNEEEAHKIIYIFGMLGDKDYDSVARLTAGHAAQIITVTPPDNPRALSANDLAATVSKYNQMVTASGSITEALEMAYLLADSDSVIIAFGSLSFLGEISRQVESKSIVLRKKDTKI